MNITELYGTFPEGNEICFWIDYNKNHLICIWKHPDSKKIRRFYTDLAIWDEAERQAIVTRWQDSVIQLPHDSDDVRHSL